MPEVTKPTEDPGSPSHTPAPRHTPQPSSASFFFSPEMYFSKQNLSTWLRFCAEFGFVLNLAPRIWISWPSSKKQPQGTRAPRGQVQVAQACPVLHRFMPPRLSEALTTTQRANANPPPRPPSAQFTSSAFPDGPLCLTHNPRICTRLALPAQGLSSKAASSGSRPWLAKFPWLPITLPCFMFYSWHPNRLKISCVIISWQVSGLSPWAVKAG